MHYILTTGWEDGIADLTERLVCELASGKRVLWLVSGGSNILASVQIMNNISAHLSHGLGVMPADERYGPPGHSDSNWTQLMTAGFKSKQASLIRILESGTSFEQTAERYDQLANNAFGSYDIIVAQLGIGADGHLAGILPETVATRQTEALVVGYSSPPLRRLTLTFTALRRIDAAFAFAFGDVKQAALRSLHDLSLAIEVQPAQILKELPEAYIYSDQVDEDV